MKRSEIIASFVIIVVAIIIASVFLIQIFSMKACLCGGYVVSATAERIGNDSIAITYKGGPDADHVMANDSFIIQINDKNATNMDAIRQSGLSATLDPVTGLENKEGSRVTITGSDISYKTHVTVITNWDDGSGAVILSTDV